MQQEMKKVILDGTVQNTPEAVHAALAAGLGFPEWYGGNLDALHDCLTDVRNAMVLLRNAEAMGDWGQRLRRVLTAAATENQSLLFVEQRR